MDANWIIDYPIWELGFSGGGLLIICMAVIHVYIAHFAVGGGLFLVLTEMKGYRENNPEILDYVKKHARFFLLLTMVFGSMTGVGIWLVISVLSPSATSTLIHYFVFGWATEWVFFLCEIITLFVYYYRFGKMNRKDHLTVGWIYFIFAWLSLLVVNAIVSFMLTPGKWVETQNFWHGFFNPTFFSSLFFRTCLSFMLAGLFGYITSVHLKKDELRHKMVRYCSWWLIFPLLFLLEAAYWYAGSIPEPQRSMIFNKSAEIAPFIKTFLWLSPAIFVAGVIMAFRMPKNIQKGIAFALLIIGLIYVGAFEWIREAGRRPYIIYNYIYSNAVPAAQADRIKTEGLLKTTRWVKHRSIDETNEMDAGREIFHMLCAACHSIGGPVNDILPITRKYTVFAMDSFLDGMGKIGEYMPTFMGNHTERKALAVYIIKGLHQKPDEPFTAAVPKALPVDIPAFDPDTDEYLILPWSRMGMRFLSDNNRYICMAPPGNDLYAQVFRRGEIPEKLSDSVKVSYRLEDGYHQPSRHIDYWKYPSLQPDKKQAETNHPDSQTTGTMIFDPAMGAFAATGIPVSPYKEDGTFNPYPLVTIEARDVETGDVLASTRAVASVTTEMGCRNCHGGTWRVDGKTGISDETALDILKVHDRINRTDLLSSAQAGHPASCRKCHTNSRDKSDESGKKLNLSAAIHGFHANFLTGRDGEACTSCHPSAPDSYTQCLRGIHQYIGLDCTNCHGKMEDHALSLLTAEKQNGKKTAENRIRHLNPRSVDSVDEIAPRTPWINAPDCLTCHVDFNAPETDIAQLNRWTDDETRLYRMRTDDMGIVCAACHGTPHALYPATSIFGNDRDNIPPMQYQKNPYPIAANKNCRVCHTVDMEDSVHHPNMLNMFRNLR